MVFLKDFKQVRAIQWGTNYNWDIKFDGAPSPFSDWFPVTELDLNIGDGIPFTYMPARQDYKFPMMKSSGTISLTYYDDDNNTLFNWINKWFSDIYSSDGGILSLKESVKKLTVLKTDLKKNIIDTTVYYVFPYGDHSYKGQSSPELMLYTTSFNIAGHI